MARAKRTHFICAACGEGSGRKGKESWWRDEDGDVYRVDPDGNGKDAIYTTFIEPNQAYKKDLEGAEVCWSCMEQVSEYGSRVLVWAPGDDPEEAGFFAHYYEGLIQIERDGGETDTCLAWTRGLGKATTYHRTDAWRGYSDTPDKVETDKGTLVRVDDMNLLSMSNDEEVKDSHLVLLEKAGNIVAPVVMVVHLTSNVFSTLVEHYMLEADVDKMTEAEAAAEAAPVIEEAHLSYAPGANVYERELAEVRVLKVALQADGSSAADIAKLDALEAEIKAKAAGAVQ